MSPEKKKVVFVLVALILLSVVLTFFNRPKPPRLELVSPQQELPEYTMRYPGGDTSLAERLVKSYGIAMVLVQSPYTDRNVIALESVRSWAQERFRHDPDFLHPIVLEPDVEPRQTVVDSLMYNLFAPIRYLAVERVGELLRGRIEQFHNTAAYTSFRNAYFDLFGVDGEAAALLARYQSDKAKLAVPVIVWTVMWAAALIAGIAALARSKSRFDTLQNCLAFFWLIMSGTYMMLAWLENQLPFLVACGVSAAIGLYLKYPFALRVEADSGSLRIQPVTIGTNWLALILWLSFSLVCIQVTTWIRMGTPNSPDPITLLLSSVSGNFLQDPVRGKRVIMTVFGVIWTLTGLWTVTQARGEARSARKVEEELASLKGPSS